MDKKKILKREVNKSSKYSGIVGPYDPYAKSEVPGAYVTFSHPTAPGGNSKK